MKILDTQKGLSVIEMMVALAISSFLILGITQVYLNNKRTYSFQQSMLSMRDSARFMEIVLNGLVAKAGESRDPEQLIDYVFPETEATTDCGKFFRGAAVTNLSNGDKGFCLRYQPLLDTEVDCQGNTVKSIANSALDKGRVFDDTSREETVVLAIKFNADSSRLSGGTLTCKNLNSAAASSTDAELLTGLADFRVEFGVGKFDLVDGEQKIEEFILPSAIKGIDNRVLSVRYEALFASQNNQRDSSDQPPALNSWLSKLSGADKTRLGNNDARDKPAYVVSGMTHMVRGIAK